MNTDKKPRGKFLNRLTFLIFLYAACITYPAYVQTDAWLAAKLNTWAAARVKATMPAPVQTAMDEWNKNNAQ